MKLRITPDDLKRGKVVKPGWYNCQIKNVEEKPAGTDGSQNWNVHILVLGGDFDGVLVYKTFNEKATGRAVKFVEAFGVKVDEKTGAEIDLSRTIGKKVKVYIKNKLYQGDMKNEVEDFAPFETETARA